MTDKIVLSSIGNLIDVTTAESTLNSNFAAIVKGFDNTLSLNGVAPNYMQSNLDMNSKHVLNLPAPISANEPARLTDIQTLTAGGSITFNSLPTGGTAGQALIKNSSSNYDVGWNNSYAIQTASVNPTATSSLSVVMAGLGSTAVVTPTYSGRVKVEFVGYARNSAAVPNGTAFHIRYGTGAPPVNGVAQAGTELGSFVISQSGADNNNPFTLTGILTGLVNATTYWFDIGFQAYIGGTATLSQVCFNAMEF